MGKTHEYVVGHNPVGGWMVLALLLLLATQAVLGLFSNDEIATTGPLARYISDEASIKLMSRHRLIGDLLLIMVGCTLPPCCSTCSSRRNLVRAMFSGRKGTARRARPRAEASRKASMPLGFILLSIAIAAVAIAVNRPALFKS